MNYQEASPSPDLAGFIKCFWALEYLASSNAAPEPVLPDGCPEIVFNLSDRFLRAFSGKHDTQPATLIAGQMTRGIVITPTGNVNLFGVRFHPSGAFPLLGFSLDAITDEIVELSEAIGSLGSELEDRVNAARSFEQRVAIFEELFITSLLRNGETDPVTAQAVRLLVESAGQVSVADVAERVGSSARTLERRFNRHLGISPKVFARVMRFQHVVRVFQDGSSANILDAALASGYYDQSHLIRDFKQFSGASPIAFFERAHRISDIFTGGITS